MHEEEEGGLGQGGRGMGREMDAIENTGEEHMVNGENGEGPKGESDKIERGMMREMRGQDRGFENRRNCSTFMHVFVFFLYR